MQLKMMLEFGVRIVVIINNSYKLGHLNGSIIGLLSAQTGKII